MSNNFVELKGCVFKKFETNNLFQMSCSGEWACVCMSGRMCVMCVSVRVCDVKCVWCVCVCVSGRVCEVCVCVGGIGWSLLNHLPY